MAEEIKNTNNEETKIPVFAVLKNGTVVKNIFLNNPQWVSADEDRDRSDREECPVLIGRHPDCHIVLDHPSISRFHLDIRAEPRPMRFSVTDLSSVHGTWVSGNKIQPNIPVDLKEGDTVKLGASTRVYRLHWIPLSSAFEMENPLPAVLEENEETHQELLQMENTNQVCGEEIPSAPPLPLESENQSPMKSSAFEMDNLFLAVFEVNKETTHQELLQMENMNEVCAEEIPSGPPLPLESENQSSMKSSAYEMDNPFPAVLQVNKETHQEPLQMENMNEVCAEEIPSAPPLPLESENQSPVKSSALVMDNPFPAVLEVDKETHQELLQMENMNEVCADEIPSAPPLPLVMDNSFPAVIEVDKETHQELLQMENMNEVCADEIPSAPPLPLESKNLSPLGFVSPISECEGENMTPAKDFSANEVQPVMGVKSASCILSRRSKSKTVSFLRVQTGRSERKNGKASNNGEKRGRGEENFCRALFGKLNGEEEGEEKYVSDKENMTPSYSTAQKFKRNERKSTAVPEPNGNEEKEEEIFVSDKENMTPSVEIQRISSVFAVSSLEHVSKADNAILTPKAPSSLKRNKPISELSSGIKLRMSLEEEEHEDALFHSDKENVTPGVSRGRKSKKLCSKIHNAKERVPFQSLLENNSPLGCRLRLVDKERAPFQSLTEKSPLRNSSSVNYAHKLAVESDVSSIPVQSQCMEQVLRNEGEKKVWNWNMVVDAGCLLNEESRKSLQLLEGLKGTHLIIPRIVIRELDCMKRREGRILYRKERKAASSALQWIEECMVKCSWWIHVQSSSETLPVPPTPPATPRSQSGNGKEENFPGASSSSTVFSTCGSLMEIVSPTAEDNILDCALLFKRIKYDQQFVLLSDSITLKIKAMAEGLICESAKEFHASLVNPYSKRFLWTSSSPRGSTWSCVDEVALTENYSHQFPAVGKLAKPSDDIKGLKLILLHNAHYGKTNLIKH